MTLVWLQATDVCLHFCSSHRFTWKWRLVCAYMQLCLPLDRSPCRQLRLVSHMLASTERRSLPCSPSGSLRMACAWLGSPALGSFNQPTALLASAWVARFGLALGILPRPGSHVIENPWACQTCSRACFPNVSANSLYLHWFRLVAFV